ncbi:hypothetical protein BB560_004068 [Smittium megazygosporum]|uniref:Exocyst complex component Sec8 n=1 Tax=Smittium megazygosporum TaxID=133381 RepID=A0A2T9ZA87_9FUNG|nr:hypothetical protein BB560_004068 [Smittium megazygosporum]
MSSSKDRKEQAIKKAEDELNRIDYKWSLIKSEKYNPVTVALQMLDTSSLGKSHQEFSKYHNRLNNSLKAISEEYYEGFNDSILTFSGLYDKLSTAAVSVRKTRASLINAKKMLIEPREDLNQLYTKSKQLSEIVALLTRIQEINRLPSEIKESIEKKQFLTAVSQLVQAIKFLFDPELRPIEALSELRQLMEREKDEITRVMIEELHNHIYLKSPYCVQGVEPIASNSASNKPFLQKRKSEKATKREKRGSFTVAKSGMYIFAFDQTLMDFLIRILEISVETNTSLEADSFAYVELLMESLLVLNKVDDAIDAINDRVRWELSNVVDNAISEVEYREKISEIASIGLITNESSTTSIKDQLVFQDLIRTFYSKLNAVLNYHDHLTEVIKNLNQREAYVATYDKRKDVKPKKIKLYNKTNLWNAMILMMLTYYLIPSAQNQGDVIEQTKISTGDSRYPKTLFVMRDNEYVREKVGKKYDTLMEKYQVLKGNAKDVHNVEIEDSVAVDHYSTDFATHKHKALVSPNIELAPILFSATSQFISEVSMPSQFILNGSRQDSIETFSDNSPDFLKRFYVQVFMPEAEAEINKVFYESLLTSDIFQPQYVYEDDIKRPIFKSASMFSPLVRSHQILHDSLGFDVEVDKWKSLVEIIEKYYDRVLSKYHDTINTNEGKNSTSAEWAKDDRLKKTLTRQFESKTKNKSHETEIHRLEKQVELEIDIIDTLKRERSLFYAELIFDYTKLVFLALLRQSLKHIHDTVYLIDELGTKRSSATSPNLRSSYAKIKNLLSFYLNLATECLVILRIEIISHVIYYLDLATREGRYFIEPNEEESQTAPNQYILALNADLNTIYEKMSMYLPENELSFLFDGISFVMANCLVANGKYIKSFNRLGCKKMLKNILCLQQNLTNISFLMENGLGKATIYYTLFEGELDSKNRGYILKHISENGSLFTFDQYKRIIDLVYEALSDEDGSMVSPEKERDRMAEYSSYISKLRNLVPLLESKASDSKLTRNLSGHSSSSKLNSSLTKTSQPSLKQAVSLSDIGLKSLNISKGNIFSQGLFK